MIRLMLNDVVGISETSIDNNIRKLKDLGYIVRVGTKKVGYWSIVGINE